MPSLAGRDLLDLWDRALGPGPVERARVLAGFGAGADDDGARRLTLGEANAALLRLREAVAGPTMEAVAGCPACGETVEWTLAVADLLALDAGPRPGPVPIEVAGWHVRWHAPTLADLLDPVPSDPLRARGADPLGAQGADLLAAAVAPGTALLNRCVEHVKDPDGRPAGVASLPPAVRAALAEALEAVDPLAEISADLTCPRCGTAFVSDVDVPAFVWAEVDVRARRLLADVATLARAYGWTEPEVLALSEARRAAYLRLATEGLAADVRPGDRGGVA